MIIAIIQNPDASLEPVFSDTNPAAIARWPDLVSAYKELFPRAQTLPPGSEVLMFDTESPLDLIVVYPTSI